MFFLSSSSDSSVKIKKKSKDLNQFRCHWQLQLKQSPLEDHLRDPVGLECFSEYINSIHCPENLHFWIEVEKLQTIEGPLEVSIMSIYERFFHVVNSPEPLNLRADHIVEVQLAMHEKKWDKIIFNNAKNWIVTLMKTNTHDYTTSGAFDKFLEAKWGELERLERTQTTKRGPRRTSNKKRPKSMALNSVTPTLPHVSSYTEKTTVKRSRSLPRDKKEDKQKARLRMVFNKANKTSNGTLPKKDLTQTLATTFNKQDITYLGMEILEKHIKQHQTKNSDDVTFDEFLSLYRLLLNDPAVPPDVVQQAKKADMDFKMN